MKVLHALHALLTALLLLYAWYSWWAFDKAFRQLFYLKSTMGYVVQELPEGGGKARVMWCTRTNPAADQFTVPNGSAGRSNPPPPTLRAGVFGPPVSFSAPTGRRAAVPVPTQLALCEVPAQLLVRPARLVVDRAPQLIAAGATAGAFALGRRGAAPRWCGRWESNPQALVRARDFKSLASASSATPAVFKSNASTDFATSPASVHVARARMR
jgi:hypothetical protein